MLRDQGSKKGTLKSTEEIMANGGCNVAQTIYENGQEWHPVLPSHGEQKCIKCRCKVSIFKKKKVFVEQIYTENISFKKTSFFCTHTHTLIVVWHYRT